MFEQAYFQNDDAARDHIEALLWPEGPVCPHCGCMGHIGKVNAKRRAGLYTCNDCHKQFTVTVGTIFERSPGAAAHVDDTRPTSCARPRRA